MSGKYEAAVRAIEAGAERIRTLAGLALLASLSLALVVFAAQHRLNHTVRDVRVLEWAASLAVEGQPHRECYGKAAGSVLHIPFNVELPRERYKDYLAPENPILSPIVADLYADVSLECREKLASAVNDVLNEAKEKHPTRFAPSAELPVALSESMPAMDVLVAMQTPQRIAWFDCHAMSRAILDALMKLTDPNWRERPVVFEHDGLAHEVQEGVTAPFEVDARAPIRAKDLSARKALPVTVPFCASFCAQEFRPIHSAVVLLDDYVELRIRFSGNRPAIGQSNAFEDSPVFQDVYRWPVVAWPDGAMSQLRWNHYGDLYLFMRAPLFKGTVPAVLDPWPDPLTALCLNVPANWKADAANLLMRLRMSDAPQISLHDLLQKRRSELEAARDDLTAKVGDLDVPIYWALLASWTVLAVCSGGILYQCARLWRLRRDHDVIEDVFTLDPSPILHVGPLGRACRVVLLLAPSVLALVVVIAAHEPLIVLGSRRLDALVSLALIAFALLTLIRLDTLATTSGCPRQQ